MAPAKPNPRPKRQRKSDRLLSPDATKAEIACEVDGCENPQHVRGWCNAHYLRWRRHGDPLAGGTSSGAPLDWAKQLLNSPTDECVFWPFAKNGNGYGWAYYQGGRIGAHRLLLVLATGKTPQGLAAAHGPCHNRLCVNPRHLSWKTQSANINDIKRDKSNSGYLLNQAKAEAIRASNAPAKNLAEEYGVCVSLIFKVRQNKLWASPPEGRS